jgi:hypothetical protein
MFEYSMGGSAAGMTEDRRPTTGGIRSYGPRIPRFTWLCSITLAMTEPLFLLHLTSYSFSLSSSHSVQTASILPRAAR